MDQEVKAGRIEEEPTELAVLMSFESEKMPAKPSSLRRFDAALGGAVKALYADNEFRGKKGQSAIIHTLGKVKAKRLLLLGLGEKAKFNPDVLRKAAAFAATKARDMNLQELAVEVPEEAVRLPMDRQAEALTTGSFLSLYRFEKYVCEKDRKPKLKKLTLVSSKRGLRKATESANRAMVVADAVFLARDIANDSGPDGTPKAIVEIALEQSKKNGVKCQVFDEKELEKRKMGGILNVGRGSENPPRLVVMEYGSPRRPTVAIVGKGITFDSGGISIKPSKDMDVMKSDKSGAAVTIAVMQAAARLKLPVHLIGLAPLAENMPSGRSYKPGDIIRTMSGKTVEVLSTDAEGRLILADALTFAQTFKPRYIVDLATLTGACLIALGHHAAGLMGNNEALKRALKSAGDEVGERVWELPLFEAYYEQIKSEVSDMKNTGGSEGGAITAGAFLGRFIESSNWAHIDIAGTSWSGDDKGYLRKGATAFGVRLLMEFISKVK